MLTTESALRKDRTTKATLEHRHFAVIAAILKGYKCSDESRKAHVIEHFADELAATNPRFDRSRFITACTR